MRNVSNRRTLAPFAPVVLAAQPKGGHAMPRIDKDTLADAIKAHVEKVASEHGGVYPLTDPETGQELELKLVRVHRERLSETAPDTYFACTDFTAADGKTYDVDFFMTGKTPDDPRFQDFSIHKVDGKPRPTWYEEDGAWKKRPVG
jgi:hypothetical protein